MRVARRDDARRADRERRAPGAAHERAAELAALPRPDDSAAAPLRADSKAATAAAQTGGPVPLSTYPMMLLGELLGVGLALAYVGFVLQLDVVRGLWFARIFGEVTKAWAGSRWMRRQLGRPATSDQRVRAALWYTCAVSGGAVGLVLTAMLTLPLPARMSEGLWSGVLAGAQHGPVVLAAVVFVGTSCLVLLRYLLLTTFNPRR